MFNLRTIALKLFRASLLQVCLSIMTVASAVALIVMMCTYGFSAKKQFDQEQYAQYGDTDMMFGYEMTDDLHLTPSLLQEMEHLDNIEAISPVVLQVSSHIDTMAITAFGVKNDALVKSRFHFTKDLSSHTVAVTSRVASSLQKTIGDDIHFEGQSFTIQEIIQQHEPIIWLSYRRAQQLYPQMMAGKFALVQVTDDAYITDVATKISRTDAKFRVDIQNEAEAVVKNIESLLIFIIVLSVFTIIIAGTLLLTNFQIIFSKLVNQLRRLRLMGATTKQVASIVFTQLFCITAIGVGLGAIVGSVLMTQIVPLLIQRFDLLPMMPAFPLWIVSSIAGVCFVVLQLFVGYQVYRTSRLMPAQMTQKQLKRLVWTKQYTIWYMGVSLVSALLLALGSKEHAPIPTLIGTIMIVMQCVIVLPYVMQWLIQRSLVMVRAVFGKHIYLALQQLMPQLRKNSSVLITILCLMIMLIFTTTTMKSAQQSGFDYIHERFTTEVIATHDVVHTDIAYNAHLLETVQQMKGVESVTGVSMLHGYSSDGNNLNGYAVFTSALAPNEAIITAEKAALLHVEIGDVIPLEGFDDEGNQQVTNVTIVGIEPELHHNENYHIQLAWQPDKMATFGLYELYIEAPSETDFSELQTQYPSLYFETKTAILKENSQLIMQRNILVKATLSLLFFIAIIGIIQTLLHASFMRLRDYQINRLLGVTPQGLRKLILYQALIFISYGIVCGLLLGIGFTQVFWQVSSGEQLNMYDVFFIGGTLLTLISLTALAFVWQGYAISRMRMDAVGFKS